MALDTLEVLLFNVRDEDSSELYRSERELRYNVLRKPLDANAGQGAELFEFELDAIHVVALDQVARSIA